MNCIMHSYRCHGRPALPAVQYALHRQSSLLVKGPACRHVAAQAQTAADLPGGLRNIVGAFQMVPDPMARYKQLLYFASKLEGLEEGLKIEENKVQGCVSQVWVVPDVRDGKIYWRADSDAQLTKGLAALLVKGLSGCAPEEIVNVEADFIEMLGLKQSLTPSRNNGFLNMFRLMQAQAVAAMQGADCAASSAQSQESAAPSQESNGNGAGGRSVMAARVEAESSGEARAPDAGGAAEASSSSAWEPTDACPKPVAASIERKIKEGLQAQEVVVLDESSQHAGHAGARSTVSPSGETHMRVSIVAAAFAGLNTVKRHRMVYALLQEELAGPVHALSLDTKAPSEA